MTEFDPGQYEMTEINPAQYGMTGFQPEQNWMGGIEAEPYVTTEIALAKPYWMPEVDLFQDGMTEIELEPY